ncbi:MAG: hypothetical protein AB7P76_12070 [Candidatus Melainabacteria bacterium]
MIITQNNMPTFGMTIHEVKKGQLPERFHGRVLIEELAIRSSSGGIKKRYFLVGDEGNRERQASDYIRALKMAEHAKTTVFEASALERLKRLTQTITEQIEQQYGTP